ELDHEVDTGDGAAELLDEPGDRLHGATRCEHVVVDDDPRAAGDGVGGDLERVLAVLERVGRRDGRGRELAGSPRSDEAAAGLNGDGCAEPEAACLRAEHEIGSPLPRPSGELAYGLSQRLPV